MPRTDVPKLQKSIAQLGEVVIDPGRWKDVIGDISHSVSSTGAILLRGENRTRDVPTTDGIIDLMHAYFDGNFHMRDIRAERSVPLILRGHLVIDDTDIVTPGENGARPDVRRSSASWLSLVRCGWISGRRHGLGIDHSPQDQRRHVHSGGKAIAVATVAKTFRSLDAVISYRASRAGRCRQRVEMIKHAAMAVDRFGNVLEVNAAAARIFDDEFYMKGRRLFVKDSAAEERINALFDQLAVTPDLREIPCDPIVVRKKAGPPLIIRVLPVHPAAKIPFLGARALFVIAPPEKVRSLRQASLMEAYKLTRAEARIAGEIAAGESLENIAMKFGVSRDTIRNQLKSIFSKTGISRQIDLVLLLNQFKD